MDGAFRPAAVFGDRMVLGRGRPIPIFGDAPEGCSIRAELNGRHAQAVASGGRFLVTLPPMPAGGPHRLTVTDGQTTVAFGDVYVGEVFLAGGQSNMEMRLREAGDGVRLARRTDQPLVRFFNAPRNAWLDSDALQAERQSRWQAATPDVCLEMSAVAYHFATRLQQALGVAVGILDCCWGGTSAACWIPEPELRKTEEGTQMLAQRDKRSAGLTPAQMDEAIAAHEEGLRLWNEHIDAARKAEPGVAMQALVERFGPCPWNPPPFGRSPFRPAGLAHTMLSRLSPYPLTGFLYYQGEEDTRHPDLYEALLTSLIHSWRRLFRGEDLPFLFAQLPMFHNSFEPDTGNWAQLRQAQARVRSASRNCEMAVLIDCGELDNIHPTDKQPVGERLCRLALRHMYGREAEADSPRALWAYPEGGALVVELTAAVRCSGEPALFEVAGADGLFRSAAAVPDGTRIRLVSADVAYPMAARYAWVNYGVVNVFGENGLPLAPFLVEM